MKSWKPLSDRILLKQDEAPMLHPGTGVVMSEQDRVRYRPNTGTVVDVGSGRRYDDGVVYPPALSKGMGVMFAAAETLTKVEHAGAEHLVMREQDVFLVLDKPEKQYNHLEWVAERRRQGQTSAILVQATEAEIVALKADGCNVAFDEGSNTHVVTWQNEPA